MHEQAADEVRKQHEDSLAKTTEPELTDEQLHQLAEGANSWGAGCTGNAPSCP